VSQAVWREVSAVPPALSLRWRHATASGPQGSGVRYQNKFWRVPAARQGYLHFGRVLRCGRSDWSYPAVPKRPIMCLKTQIVWNLFDYVDDWRPHRFAKADVHLFHPSPLQKARFLFRGKKLDGSKCRLGIWRAEPGQFSCCLCRATFVTAKASYRAIRKGSCLRVCSPREKKKKAILARKIYRQTTGPSGI